MAKPLRCAIVGVGAGVFNMHRPGLQREDVHIVAVSDVAPALGHQRAEELGAEFFADHVSMLASARPDFVVVVAPHPFHAPIAIDCLRAGAHVLVEKPIAVQVADADRMIAAAQAAGRLLAVNFQQRTRPDVRAAHGLLAEGRLGEIQRVQMLAIWTRTAAYYGQAGWRGTWRGEGGGVLMNQSPHNLDLLCHLAGQPARVAAWTRRQFHAIETEDTAMAMLEWSNGALGTLLVSTAEMGEPERIEIGGTRGTLRLERGSVTFFEADQDLRTFLSESPEPFGKLALHEATVQQEAEGGNHAAVYDNFISAITSRTPLAADGRAGRESLELANAMILSSHTNQQVSLPLDRQVYAELLARLQAERT